MKTNKDYPANIYYVLSRLHNDHHILKVVNLHETSPVGTQYYNIMMKIYSKRTLPVSQMAPELSQSAGGSVIVFVRFMSVIAEANIYL